MLLFTLTGCFGELFASRTVYLATEYQVRHPRLVAMALDPPRLEPDREYTLEWLLLAPRGQEVGDYQLRTCALGREVVTYIGDLNCFQDPQEVVDIATGSGASMTFTPPETPAIDECGVIWDSGWWDSGLEKPPDGGACAHELPLLLEGAVGGEPVFSAGWVSWYTSPLETEAPDSLRRARISLEVPAEGAPGETVEARLSMEGDLRSADFFWYVDDGVLEGTGWTAAHTFADDDPAWPNGLTTTTNHWTLPDEGSLRIAVVVVFNGRGDDMVDGPDNHWVVEEVEVR